MADIKCLVILLCAGLIALALVFTFDNSRRNQTNPSRLSVLKDAASGKRCMLPPHPSSGRWSIVNNVSNSSLVPAYTVLQVHCNETYKLDGGVIVVCINETWFPQIGRCLKTCPSLYSTSKMTVTCIFKEQATANCTQPVVGTLAQFRCASFYEDRRRTKTRAVCRNNGEWSEIPDCSPVCGRATIGKAPVLTVGGKNTTKGEFPWQVALYAVKDKKLLCGGSLLNERVVLTAAHCVTDNINNTILPKEDYLMVAGKYYRKFNHSEESKYTQVSEIHDIFVPAEYEGEDQNFAYDVAIIVTKKVFKFSTTIQPVCIDWERKYENEVFNNSNNYYGYVSGWGNTKPDSQPANELKKIMVPSVSRKECKKHVPDDFRRYVTYDKFCAGYINKSMFVIVYYIPSKEEASLQLWASYFFESSRRNKAQSYNEAFLRGTSVCNGDSGGGLVYKYEDEDEGRYFIVGIVSIAPQTKIASTASCDSEKYSLYTLVYNHTDFILAKIVEFEPKHTNEEICRNCSEPDASTELPITELTTLSSEKNQSEYCTVPKHPDYGRWSVYGVTHLGTTVPPGTLIKMNCQDNYKYDAPDLNVCKNGKWSEPLGKCLIKERCPSLYDSEKRNATCSFRDMQLENCINPVHGVIARFKCAKFYEFSYLGREPSVCLDGRWNYVPECVPACGQPSHDSSKIKFPWYAAIYRSDNNKKSLICGGSLVSLKVIVTAKFCISNETREFHVVAAGVYHRQFNHSDDLGAQFSPVLAVHYAWDIAMVVLEKPFKLSTTVQQVCVDWEMEYGMPQGTHGSSISWVSTGSGKKQAEIIAERKFYVGDVSQCPYHYNARFKICAKPVTKDAYACRFDSGRGLFVERQGRYYLKGVELFETADQVHRDDEMCTNSSGSYQTGTFFYDMNIELISSRYRHLIYE